MPTVTVALTGGIGAGKTEALRAFARRGVPTQSADEIVHRLIAEDPEVRSALEERWGRRCARIAEIVFADREQLAWLEGLLHPRVRDEEETWLDEVDAEVAVTEIPLLYETGGEKRFDVVVVITAPAELRKARSQRAAADARAERLIPDEEKVERADFAYVNDGTLDELDAFVGRVLQHLQV
jgi:dephospho-CoA kinase